MCQFTLRRTLTSGGSLVMSADFSLATCSVSVGWQTHSVGDLCLSKGSHSTEVATSRHVSDPSTDPLSGPLSCSCVQSRGNSRTVVMTSGRNRHRLSLLQASPESTLSRETIAIRNSVGQRRLDNMAISNFHISFQGDRIRYKPGEELCGTVIMDVWATVEVKYVEFVITGRGTLRTFRAKNNNFQETPRFEVYLEKKIVLIGPQTGSHGVKVTRTGVTLTPGRYVSHFKYVLPMELPPSVHQFDLGEGHVFDVTYAAAAHVCDNLRSRYLPRAPQLIRVVKATKCNFVVEPYHNWQSLPNALEPISHAEQLKLSCGLGSAPTTVMIQLERGVYPLGDAVNLHVEILAPDLRKVKEVKVEVEQSVLLPFGPPKKFTNVLIKAFDNYRHRDQRKLRENITRSSFSIHLPPRLVPSYLPYCHLVGISYNMKISVVFKGLGGVLVMRLPIVIAPESYDREGRYETGSLTFKRPLSWNRPYEGRWGPHPVTRSSEGHSSHSTDNSRSRLALRGMASVSNPTGHTGYPTGHHNNRLHRSNRVSSKYISCCQCCASCFGFGLFD